MSGRTQRVWSVVFLLGFGFAQSPQRAAAADPVRAENPVRAEHPVRARDPLVAKAPASDAEAAQYVRQALEFRLEGDTQYSQMLLRLALRMSPDYAPAHWASGELQVDGEWTTVSDALSHFKDDPALKEYCALRERLADSAEADLRLARWCRRQGWEDSERVHLVRQLRNPETTGKLRVESMRKLGYYEFEGALMTREEIRQLQQLRNRDRKALQKWFATVERWDSQLASEKLAVRQHARKQLQSVTDPTAIPAIESILVMSECEFAPEAVQVIGQMETPESTRFLVRVALFCGDASSVQVATELLRERPLHDYTPLLLAALSAKLESRFKVVTDDSGLVYHEHVVRQGGPTGNRVAVRRNLAIPRSDVVGQARVRRGSRQGRDVALENQLRGQIQRQFELTRLSLAALNIEQQVAESNRSLEQTNSKVFGLLHTLTEANVPSDAAAWWDWWQGYNEVYAYDQPVRTCYEDNSYGYHVPVVLTLPSCFAAGTPVWTAQGSQAIESIQAGDRVLSQDVDTGELGFRVVATTTIRPAVPLLQIQVRGTQVLTTEGHPFWVEGFGWRMAKLLEEGNVVCTREGSAPIESIHKAAAQQAYNLVVDGTHNYFVGQLGILVHDNNYREPTCAVTPGLRRQRVELAAD